MKIAVVLNEFHTIIKDQKKLISVRLGDEFDIAKVENKMWSKPYFDSLRERLEEYSDVVFISPVSILIAEMSYRSGKYTQLGMKYSNIWIMHADDKVECDFGLSTKYIAKADAYRLLLVN